MGLMEHAFSHIKHLFSCLTSSIPSAVHWCCLHAHVSTSFKPYPFPATCIIWRNFAMAVATPSTVEFIDIFDAPNQLGGSFTLIGFASPRLIG